MSYNSGEEFTKYDMIAFWGRVKDLLSDDLNQSWLSKEIGVSHTTMSSWINRDRLPKVDLAVKIARALGVSVEYLVTGKESSEDDEHINTSKNTNQPKINMNGSFLTPSQKEYTLSTNQRVINIPILDQKVSAGFGENSIELYEPEKVLPVLEQLVARYDRDKLRVVEVKGDSMTGVQLFNGDLAVFAAGYIEGDGIYVISIHDEAYVKRLEFEPFENRIIIHSENTRYQPKAIPADTENIKIEGKVIGWYHNHPY